jgi:hypothetical protein
MINTSGWTCPSGSVLGGYSMTCVSCLETMCLSQLTACMTGSCSSCEGPVYACETQSCNSPCSAGGGSSGSGGGTPLGDGAPPSGACASLMACCSLVGAVSPSDATECSSTAESNNENSCQSFITAINSVVPGVCQ